ncbi:hypothetical protein [Streptomyces sp. NPDC006334]|uniref:hypothetical protein n=1 Tax=Streptomyces sp. NPDC006334 TaxID=3156754 RepID=UPI0033AAD799
MHEHFRPWGNVTPDFWATSDPPRSETEHPMAVAPQQSALVDKEPPATPAAGHANVVQHQDVAATAGTAQQTASAQMSGSAAEVELPPGFQERIASVTSAFNHPEDHQRLHLAGVEAEMLDQELTEHYGQQHTHTINIREVRGWLANLAGQPEVAARWYLHTTGLQITLHGANHAHTEASARRAVHTWQQVTDPAAVVQIGGDLAKVVAVVFGEGSDVARFVQARLSRRRPQQ